MDAARRTERAAMTVAWRRGAVALAILLLGHLTTPDARAGQVRVNVGVSGAQSFTPYAVNVNIGDQVVWVWASSNHTVTNWNPPGDSAGFTYDGSIFDSATGIHLGQPGTTRFSWKSDRLGHVPYVCAPHIPDMSGRVIISDPQVVAPVPVAEFRITEVQYNGAGGLDRIEITNYGLAAGDLGSYRLATLSTGSGVQIPANSFVVPPDGRVTVHNTAGVDDATNIYLPGLGALPDAQGSLALYLPHTTSTGGGTGLGNANLMVDFVQWGAAGQPNEGTANTAGFWGSGTFIPTMAAGHSIEYCGKAGLPRGSDHWAEIGEPNFGGNGACSTPVLTETWGRLKIIYRN